MKYEKGDRVIYHGHFGTVLSDLDHSREEVRVKFDEPFFFDGTGKVLWFYEGEISKVPKVESAVREVLDE